MPVRVFSLQGNYVFRGVHRLHPALGPALAGLVVPGNVAGKVSPLQHNLGGSEADSPFTSWTHEESIAVMHALRHGRGGVVLALPLGAPPPGSPWSWEMSFDKYGEREVLLRGRRARAILLGSPL